MYPDLTSYIQNIEGEISNISKERKSKLIQLAEYIQDKKESSDLAKLTFICTHNSRRSHLCQIWAATLAEHFDIDNIKTYSGGTEATVFNPRAVAAIERAGFNIVDPGGKNPRYEVFFDDEVEPLICFSKTFDHSYNPQQHFAAVMTCTDADENCPIVPGTEFRITIPYEDPKQADGTPQEAQTYDERCRQIAAEMYYLMSQV